MAVKPTRKEKIASQQKQGGGFSPKEIQKIDNSRRSLKRMLGLIVALTGFILFSNTLGNDYVLDDFGLIKDNTQTKLGVSAIPAIFKSSYRFGMNITDYQLYRPLTKAMFAVEWELSPDNPALSHGLNVMFFALLCYVLFLVLNRYMNDSLLVPFITALIFAAHPLHTEVVANIKSRDEIVSFLLCISAAGALHSYVTKDSRRAFIAGIACYFTALFAKESSITFLAVIPLLYYFFTSATKSKYINTITAMGVCTVIFLLIRRKVLGNVVTLIPVEDNSLVGIKDFFLQKANAIYLLGVYLKLMIVPTPLMADASYNHFPPVAFTSWKFLVPFAIFIGAAVYAIMNFKKKSPIAFSILYFFVTVSIVSNVVILIGTNYGERLMFVPSLGFCLLAAIIISKFLKQDASQKVITDVKTFIASASKPLLAVLGIIIIFGIQTTARNADWKDNYTLYMTDVKKVPDSAHMLFYLANHITTDEFLAALPDSAARIKSREEAVDYLTRAVTIYPAYSDGYQRRGFIYNQMKRPDLAEADYKTGLKYNPTHPIVYNNYGTLCFDARRYDEALTNFQQAVRYNPQYAHAWNNMASVYGVYGQGETEMITKDPANRDQHIAKAREYFESAIGFFQKAVDVDKDFAEPLRLMAMTYRNLGDNEKADRITRMYNEVKARNVKN